MSTDDDLTPIPEFPGEDPERGADEPHTDGHGLSGTLDSGYDLGDEGPTTAEPRGDSGAAEQQA